MQPYGKTLDLNLGGEHYPNTEEGRKRYHAECRKAAFCHDLQLYGWTEHTKNCPVPHLTSKREDETLKP